MDTVFHFTTTCFHSLPQIHLICAAVNYSNVIGLRLINKGESADMLGNKSFLETEGFFFSQKKTPTFMRYMPLSSTHPSARNALFVRSPPG